MRRLVARRTLMVAAALTTLMAVAAVTATALVLSAAGRGSVAAALGRSPALDRVVDVAGPLAAEDGVAAAVDAADREVRDVLGGALGPTLRADEAARRDSGGAGTGGAGVVTRRVLSSSYVVPGPSAGGREPLAVVGGYEDLADHASLVEGDWPGPVGSGGVTEVVVHERAAAALDLAVGDELRLVNARDDSVLVLRLRGTFRPEGLGSGYWAGDTLGTTGVDRGGSFVTYGPFLAGSGAEPVVADPVVTWRADPALDGLTPRQVDDLRGDLAPLLDEDTTATQDAAAALAGGPDAEVSSAGLGVETDLDEVLSAVAAPVAVARSAVALALALVVLSGITAALLVTRLVQEDRRLDAELRASRGFSRGQLRAANALEAAVLVLPAAVLGPPLAWLVVRAVAATAGSGPVASDAPLGPGAWAVAAGSALVVAGLLTRRSATGAERGARGRVAATWSRLGLDLVAVPVAVVATLQLLTYDASSLATGSADALTGSGIDPVLALTVPVVVLAAALVLGRLLRGVLLVAARGAGRARGAVAALALWQLARRSDEHRAMLVSSLLAAAVVTVAVVQATTYSDSQDAQARLAVAGDLRVSGLSDPAQGDEVAARVEERGGTAVVVVRERTTLGDLPVEVVAVDAGAAAGVLDPAAPEVAWTALLTPLAEAAPGSDLPGVVADVVATRVGDAGRARLRVAGTDVEVTVSGRVAALPGVGPEADALGAGPGAGRAATGAGVLVDRAALERAVGGAALTEAETEVWASVPREAVGPIRGALRDEGSVTVADRWSASADRQDGPVGSGVRLALVLSVLVAAVLGAVGFVAAAAVGLRRRRPEVAALRATGLSRGQVTRSLALERLGLLAVALLLGTLVGATVGRLLSPRLVLSEAATVPVPEPRAALDLVTAGAVGLVLVAVGVACAAALWVFVASLVARPMSDELRAGEDT